MRFKPPAEKVRQAALGPVQNLPVELRRLLDFGGFTPIREPGPSDWLAVYPEPGQTMHQFLQSHPNLPNAARHTLYLQPLEEFNRDAPSLEKLKEFTEAFFSLPVRVLPVSRDWIR